MTAAAFDVLADLLDGGDTAPKKARAHTLDVAPTPLDLAARFDHTIVRTPALELLAERLHDTTSTADGRLLVSISPQEGKSTLLRWLCLRLLVENPDRRIVFASHAEDLARESGRVVRGLLETYAGELGLAVSADRASAADWRLRGHRGGMFAVGVGSSLTGRPADVLIIDDALAGQAEADSPVIRGRLHSWWSAVARTRLAPKAPVIVVATRWHEDDLTGRLHGQGWPLLNIPALADGHTEDALDRPAGEWMISARGRTVAEWEATRTEVGERTFAALYQGRPAPLAGGIFAQAWIDAHRADRAPDELAATCVAVDPADTGQGDAAGILVGSRSLDGHIWVRADLSGQLSQGQWARRALLAAVRFDADTILQESNLGMGRALRDGWSVIRRQATALGATGGNVDEALAVLTSGGDDAAAERDQLVELAGLVLEVLAAPSSGPARIVAVTPRQSKFVRAHAVTGLYETGRARHVGRLPLLEHEMVTWQPGQKSPNRLDTLAHLLTHLDKAVAEARVGVPGGSSSRRSGVPSRTASGVRRGGGSVSGRPTVVRR